SSVRAARGDVRQSVDDLAGMYGDSGAVRAAHLVGAVRATAAVPTVGGDGGFGQAGGNAGDVEGIDVGEVAGEEGERAGLWLLLIGEGIVGVDALVGLALYFEPRHERVLAQPDHDVTQHVFDELGVEVTLFG